MRSERVATMLAVCLACLLVRLIGVCVCVCGYVWYVCVRACQVAYTRRKRDKECYNGVQHEHGVKIHDCVCVM